MEAFLDDRVRLYRGFFSRDEAVGPRINLAFRRLTGDDGPLKPKVPHVAREVRWPFP